MNRLAKRLERIAREIADGENFEFIIYNHGFVSYTEMEADGRGTISRGTFLMGSFDSIDDLIKAVCKKFGINYNKTEWVYDVSEDKNMGYLRGEFEEKAGEVVNIQLFFEKVGESGTLTPDDSDCVGLKKDAFFGVYL